MTHVKISLRLEPEIGSLPTCASTPGATVNSHIKKGYVNVRGLEKFKPPYLNRIRLNRDTYLKYIVSYILKNNQWNIGALAPGKEGTITVAVHIK